MIVVLGGVRDMHDKLVSELRSLSKFFHIKNLEGAADLLEEYLLENERLKWKVRELEKENKKLRRYKT